MSRFRATAGILLLAVLPSVMGRYCVATTSFSSGVQTGSIQNSSVTESSGIAASRKNANVLWTHNDSGNAAQVFPMTAAGTNLGTYTISGASNTDWEDIAIGPGPTAGAEYLYVGDIGDNNGVRSNVSVYRVPEPVVSSAVAGDDIHIGCGQVHVCVSRRSTRCGEHVCRSDDQRYLHHHEA